MADVPSGYYPSARVRLIVRLEEFGSAAAPEPPPRPATARGGKKSLSKERLRVVETEGRLLLLGPGDDPTSLGSPQAQQGSVDGLTHVLDGIVPSSADLGLNGLRTADTLKLELDYADLPLDPRTVRACAVQFFLGCVSAEDYQRGVSGEVRSVSPSSGGVLVARNVVPDEYTDERGRPRTNLRFEGWVDEWEVQWPENGEPTVSLECTDNTRLLIDQEAPAGLTVPVDQPLHRAFAEYLSNFPQFRGLSVEYRPAGVEPPVLKQALQSTKFQPKLGPSPSGGAGGGKLKVWDYFTDVAGSVGHVVRLVGSTIVVQRPRTLLDDRLPTRDDDPFDGRVLPGGVEVVRRLMLYGRNVLQMSLGRKYAGGQSVNIEVRCYDTARKKTLIARYPQKGERVRKLQPGDAAEEKWRVITVHGVRDEAVLRLVAQSAYEQWNRNEITGRVVTRDLGSFGGSNLDPDLLDALPGDPVEIRVLRDTEFGNTTQETELAIATRAADLMRALGYSQRFAMSYQSVASSVALPHVFRLRTLRIGWSSSDGIDLDLEVANYIAARSDRQLPEGEEVTSSGGAASRSTVADEVRR